MSHTFCDPQETAIWFPVTPGAVTLPTADPVATDPSPLPPNAVQAPSGFDPDNPDLCELFEEILPVDVAPVYSSTQDADVVATPYGLNLNIIALVRTFLAVQAVDYPMEQETREVTFTVRPRLVLPTYIFRIEPEDAAEVLVEDNGAGAQFSYLRQLRAYRTTFVVGQPEVGFPVKISIPSTSFQLSALVPENVGPPGQRLLPAELGNFTLSGQDVQFFWPAIVALLHFDGTNNSTSFVDSSLNALTFTALGDAKISTTQSKFGGASGYFDGNGDYVRTAYNSNWNLGAGEFTIECWFRANALAGVLIAKDKYGFNFDWCIEIANSTTIRCYTNATINNLTVTVPTMSTGVWYHVALVRRLAGSTYTNYIYLDGVSYGSNTMSIANASQDYITVGCASWNNPNGFFNGYIDELRVAKSAVYTANFTPPTAAFPDPPSSPAVLLHFDGTNNSTSFVDSSLNALTFTALGDAKISTTQSKFGGASGYFDGNGDRIQAQYASAFNVVGSSFTIEAWVYPQAVGTDGTRIASSCGGNVAYNSTNGIHWLFQLVRISGIQYAQLQINGASATQGITSTATLSLSTWTHVCACVNGSTIYIGVNGTVNSAAIGTLSRPSTNPRLEIGSIYGENGSSVYAFNGFIDEFRLIKGQALYTANFTPPTAAFPNP